MKKITSALIFSLFLSGCSSTTGLTVATVAVEKPKFEIPLPSPVKMQPIQWVLITDKNYDEVMQSVKDDRGLIFLVALDETGYKNLSLNNANMLRFIREQKSVIAAYKNYYEVKK